MMVIVLTCPVTVSTVMYGVGVHVEVGEVDVLDVVGVVRVDDDDVSKDIETGTIREVVEMEV